MDHHLAPSPPPTPDGPPPHAAEYGTLSVTVPPESEGDAGNNGCSWWSYWQARMTLSFVVIIFYFYPNATTALLSIFSCQVGGWVGGRAGWLAGGRVGWLVGGWVGQLVGWWVGGLVDGSVGWLAGRLVGWWVGQLVRRLVGWRAGWLVG